MKEFEFECGVQRRQSETRVKHAVNGSVWNDCVIEWMCYHCMSLVVELRWFYRHCIQWMNVWMSLYQSRVKHAVNGSVWNDCVIEWMCYHCMSLVVELRWFYRHCIQCMSQLIVDIEQCSNCRGRGTGEVEPPWLISATPSSAKFQPLGGHCNP